MHQPGSAFAANGKALASRAHNGHRWRDRSHRRPLELFPEAEAGIAGVVLWPWATWTFRDPTEPIQALALVPILDEELATFRRDPGAQRAWCDERQARQDLDGMFARWSWIAPDS